MAELDELRELFNDSDLRNKIVAAAVIAADTLMAGTPTAADRKWAAGVYSNPDEEGRKVFVAILGANHGLTVTQIKQAGKADTLAKVNQIVPQLVLALSEAGA